MVMYAINTLLATWDSLSSKWTRGIRSPRSYAASVIHVAFLTAMLAHLVGGLWGKEHEQIVARHEWSPIDERREIRVAKVDIERIPRGPIKQIWATVHTRSSEEPTVVEEALVHFNGPLTFQAGSEVLLLNRQGELPAGALFLSGSEECALELGERCTLARPGSFSGATSRFRTTPKSDCKSSPANPRSRSAGDSLREIRLLLLRRSSSRSDCS
jgi:hypothetical protein